MPVLYIQRDLHLVNIVCTVVSAKFAGPQPQAGNNRRGGLATEAFAGPAGLAIICENYIGSYC